MGEIRRYFDSKFGTGKLVSRTRDTDSDVVQTLVGYQWIVGGTGGGTMLELFYFSAQREALVLPDHHRHLQGDVACALRPLRFFLQPLQAAGKTRLRGRAHAVDEKNSVEMIDLVLQRPRQ